MKKVLMFTMEDCPYCREAHRWMDKLFAENPAMRGIELEIIDEVEQPAIADRYDYYYVPTYYADGVKVHEGAATERIIRDVFTDALNG